MLLQETSVTGTYLLGCFPFPWVQVVYFHKRDAAEDPVMKIAREALGGLAWKAEVLVEVESANAAPLYAGHVAQCVQELVLGRSSGKHHVDLLLFSK